jgi:UDP-N-acetylmuramoyl-L-alanyl-D-glutamate--2,6-diaminopimelate ligase
MTNLTQDHLDYHGTMERYAEAKARLFNRYTKPAYCILNADDKWYDFFLVRSVGQVVSYGESSDSAERIQAVKPSATGTTWILGSGSGKLNLKTSLPGLFNVYNASAAATAALALGLPCEAIAKGVAALRQVPGRMERIEAGQPFQVLVDFAITPDALEKALSAARVFTGNKGKVRVVFGATGDRDKGKRPIMGQVAAEFADVIYLTDDETYTEDPEAIRSAVYDGIKRAQAEKRTKVIPDREEAIKQAFSDAHKGDVVVLAGLGHEDSRNMGGELIPWDDREVARVLLKN